jgi:hypothetical protein
MIQALTAVASDAGEHGRQLVLPWHQPGHPLVRVEATVDTIYPYAVRVGDHTNTRIPLTAAALRTLRDALTALLEAMTPAEPEDFVTAWAEAHGAEVRHSPHPSNAGLETGAPTTATLSTYVMAA